MCLPTWTAVQQSARNEIRRVHPGPWGVHVSLEDKLLQPWGIVHGGVYRSVIETVAGLSATVWLAGNGGGTCVGVNNNTDFLRAISSGTVIAVSTPIHRGRRQQTVAGGHDHRQKNRVVARGQVRLQNLPGG